MADNIQHPVNFNKKNHRLSICGQYMDNEKLMLNRHIQSRQYRCSFVKNLLNSEEVTYMISKHMIETDLDPENNLLQVTTTGDVDIESMMKGIAFLATAEGLPKSLKILEDATNAKAVFNYSDIKLLMEELKKVLGRFTSLRHAVIHSDPTNTAFTMLASLMIDKPNYSLQVFSTRQAAEYWLRLFPEEI